MPLSSSYYSVLLIILYTNFLELVGRTIPSFKIAAVLEEEKWKQFRKYLRNQNEKKLFTHMFSIANLYNSASSNAVVPIRIYSYFDVYSFPSLQDFKRKKIKYGQINKNIVFECK